MKKRKLKKNVVTLLLLITSAFFASTSIAFLMNNSSLTNTFEIGTIQAEITETFQNNVKSNVRVKNTGNSIAYVRCKILTYYEMGNGKDTLISNRIPIVDVDYSLDLGKDWLYINDIYYYKYPVKPNEETSALINSCHEIRNSDKDDLVVDIYAQVIQAEPSTAIEDSWIDISVDPSTLELRETVNYNE